MMAMIQKLVRLISLAIYVKLQFLFLEIVSDEKFCSENLPLLYVYSVMSHLFSM